MTAALNEQPPPELEVAHVLMMDIVGYSRLPIDVQAKLLRKLQEAVSGTEAVRRAETANKLIKLPTGDGMALVFRGDPEAPAKCALELSQVLHGHPQIGLRMGLNTGPVYFVNDINANLNVAGGGINFAQRVMDCGDGGHILVSQELASTLRQISGWTDLLHDIGRATVKHGVTISLANLYRTDVGNPKLPAKVRAAKRRARTRRYSLGIAAAALLASVATWVANRTYHTRVILQEADQVTENDRDTPVNAAAISPDGRFLAYIDKTGIHLNDPDTKNELGSSRWTGAPEFNFASDLGWAIAWAPDSSSMVVSGPVRNEKQSSIWAVAVTNGSNSTPVRLYDNASSPSVSPDGRVAFTDDAAQELLVARKGEKPHTILPHTEGRSILELAWFPDGKRLAFIEEDSPEQGPRTVALKTVKDDGMDQKVLLSNAGLGGGPNGDICGLSIAHDASVVYALQASAGKAKRSVLWKRKADVATGEWTSDAEPIYSADGFYFSDISVAASEERLYFLKLRLNYRIELATLNGNPVAATESRPLTTQQGENFPTGWTLDSKEILYTSNIRGHSDIFRLYADDGSGGPILPDGDARGAAQASPDGEWILYWTWPSKLGDDPKHKSLMRIRRGGNAAKTVLSEESGTSRFVCGKTSCVLSRRRGSSLDFLSLEPLSGKLRPIRTTGVDSSEGYDWDISPDGLTIALVQAVDPNGRIQVLQIQTPEERGVDLGAAYRLWDVAWAQPAGNGVYVTASIAGRMELVRVGLAGASSVLAKEHREEIDSPTPSPNGEYLALTRSQPPDSNVYRLKEF